jgi:hypothetical protein
VGSSSASPRAGPIRTCRSRTPRSASSTPVRWSDRLGDDLQGFTIGRGYLAQVFYDRDAIVRPWGRYAEVVEVIPEAFAGHQTAVVLRRRDDDRTW